MSATQALVAAKVHQQWDVISKIGDAVHGTLTALLASLASAPSYEELTGDDVDKVEFARMRLNSIRAQSETIRRQYVVLTDHVAQLCTFLDLQTQEAAPPGRHGYAAHSTGAGYGYAEGGGALGDVAAYYMGALGLGECSGDEAERGGGDGDVHCAQQDEEAALRGLQPALATRGLDPDMGSMLLGGPSSVGRAPRQRRRFDQHDSGDLRKALLQHMTLRRLELEQDGLDADEPAPDVTWFAGAFRGGRGAAGPAEREAPRKDGFGAVGRGGPSEGVGGSFAEGSAEDRSPAGAASAGPIQEMLEIIGLNKMRAGNPGLLTQGHGDAGYVAELAAGREFSWTEGARGTSAQNSGAASDNDRLNAALSPAEGPAGRPADTGVTEDAQVSYRSGRQKREQYSEDFPASPRWDQARASPAECSEASSEAAWRPDAAARDPDLSQDAPGVPVAYPPVGLGLLRRVTWESSDSEEEGLSGMQYFGGERAFHARAHAANGALRGHSVGESFQTKSDLFSEARLAAQERGNTAETHEKHKTRNGFASLPPHHQDHSGMPGGAHKTEPMPGLHASNGRADAKPTAAQPSGGAVGFASFANAPAAGFSAFASATEAVGFSRFSTEPKPAPQGFSAFSQAGLSGFSAFGRNTTIP